MKKTVKGPAAHQDGGRACAGHDGDLLGGPFQKLLDEETFARARAAGEKNIVRGFLQQIHAGFLRGRQHDLRGLFHSGIINCVAFLINAHSIF